MGFGKQHDEMEPATIKLPADVPCNGALPSGRVVGTPQRQPPTALALVEKLQAPWASDHDHPEAAAGVEVIRKKKMPIGVSSSHDHDRDLLKWQADPDVGECVFNPRAQGNATTNKDHFAAAWSLDEARSSSGAVKLPGPPRKLRDHGTSAQLTSRPSSQCASARGVSPVETVGSLDNSGQQAQRSKSSNPVLRRCLEDQLAGMFCDESERFASTSSTSPPTNADLARSVQWEMLDPYRMNAVNKPIDHRPKHLGRSLRKSCGPDRRAATQLLPGVADMRDVAKEHLKRVQQQQEVVATLDAQVARKHYVKQFERADDRRFREDVETGVEEHAGAEQHAVELALAANIESRRMPEELVRIRMQRAEEQQAARKVVERTGPIIGPSPLEEYKQDQRSRAKEKHFRKEALQEIRQARDQAKREAAAAEARAETFAATETSKQRERRAAEREAFVRKTLAATTKAAPETCVPRKCNRRAATDDAAEALAHTEQKALVERRLQQMLQQRMHWKQEQEKADTRNAELLRHQGEGRMAERLEDRQRRVLVEHEVVLDRVGRRALQMQAKAKNVAHKQELIAQIDAAAIIRKADKASHGVWASARRSASSAR